MNSKILFSLILTLTTSIASADWSRDFPQLKDVPRSYEDTGAICEELARLQVQLKYPTPQFEVWTGVAYETASQVLGELDLVIFDNHNQSVVKIGEVKCWKDMAAGLAKAQEQRARFSKAIRSSKPLQFRFTSTGEILPLEIFKNVQEFFSIAQQGSKSVGFDEEINYSLLDLRNHRYDMLRCQSRGECKKP